MIIKLNRNQWSRKQTKVEKTKVAFLKTVKEARANKPNEREREKRYSRDFSYGEWNMESHYSLNKFLKEIVKEFMPVNLKI